MGFNWMYTSTRLLSSNKQQQKLTNNQAALSGVRLELRSKVGDRNTGYHLRIEVQTFWRLDIPHMELTLGANMPWFVLKASLLPNFAWFLRPIGSKILSYGASRNLVWYGVFQFCLLQSSVCRVPTTQAHTHALEATIVLVYQPARHNNFCISSSQNTNFCTYLAVTCRDTNYCIAIVMISFITVHASRSLPCC